MGSPDSDESTKDSTSSNANDIVPEVQDSHIITNIVTTTSSSSCNKSGGRKRSTDQALCPTGEVTMATTKEKAAGSCSSISTTTSEFTDNTPPHHFQPPPPAKRSKKDVSTKKKSASSSSSSSSPKSERDLTPCHTLLGEMEACDDAWPFLFPVNTKQFPTYKKIIKNPIDVATIKKRLESGVYKTRGDFCDDVKLIFTNCEIFNEDDSPVGKAGYAMKNLFDTRWLELIGQDSTSSGAVQ